MQLSVQNLEKKLDLKKSKGRVTSKRLLYGNEVVSLGDDVLTPTGCAFARCADFSDSALGVYCKSSLLAFRPLLHDQAFDLKSMTTPGVISVDALCQGLGRALRRLHKTKKTNYWLAGNCLRWVHGDADGLPGIVIDEYDNLIVMQSSSSAGDFLFPYVEAAIRELFPNRPIAERSSGQTRQMAKLPERSRVIQGLVPEQVVSSFAGLNLSFRPLSCQKTGLFLDQAYNLDLFKNILSGFESNESKEPEGSENSKGSKSILDICCYVGAWSSVAAKAGFSEFYLLDQDKNALAFAETNIKNNLSANALGHKVTPLHGDMFEHLSVLGKQGRQFDVVVADPPAFAKSKTHVPEALKAYMRTVSASAALVRQGGILVVCSCSRNVTEDQFFELVLRQLSFSSAGFTFVSKGFQSPDHTVPVGESFSHYLKCGFFRKETK